MWPFDKILINRIHTLERHIETLIGSNTILERELEKAQHRESVLQENLFRVSGITSEIKEVKERVQVSIPLSKKIQNWGQVRQNLEANSQREYWEAKQKEQASKSETTKDIEQLEKDVLK